jgi:hypothetical protein
MTLLLAQISGGSGVAYTLSGATGSYTYTGNNATLVPKHNYALSGSSGVYTYTGQNATLIPKHNYVLAGQAGNYSYTGQSATLTYTAGAGSIAYSLSGATGSYLLNGQSATLTYTNRAQIIWGGAGTYKGEFGPVDDEYNEEDDEEMIIMALAHQLIEMRVI